MKYLVFNNIKHNATIINFGSVFPELVDQEIESFSVLNLVLSLCPCVFMIAPSYASFHHHKNMHELVF